MVVFLVKTSFKGEGTKKDSKGIVFYIYKVYSISKNDLEKEEPIIRVQSVSF